jgi:uncharacterized repeat protein (TIGR03847 family)
VVNEYLDPAVFTAGTIGPPGQRVFYLQAGDNGAVSSVRLEKQQVIALAEYLAGMLHDLPAPSDVPPAPELIEPVVAEWTVGNIGVAYDNDLDRIIIVAEELVAEDEPDGESLRVVLSRAQVRAFIERAEELMAGGRPPCRVCGAPMDPTGHACPRAN